MENQYYKPSSVPEDANIDLGFRKNIVNVTFENFQQKPTTAAKFIPSYTFRSPQFSNEKQKQNPIERQQIEIKSSKSLVFSDEINFSQRATSFVDPKPTPLTNQDERIKFMYEDISFNEKRYEILSPETQAQTISVQRQRQTLFSKYSKTENEEAKIQSNSQFIIPKQDPLNFKSFISTSINGTSLTQKMNYFQINGEKSDQMQQYRKKIISLQRQLTRMSLQKGELIIQVAELQRQNSDLKRELRKMDENRNALSPIISPQNSSKKIQIEEDLFLQIQKISQQQKQINKIKEEYIKLASAGYQNEIKKLLHQNNTYKLEIQSLKIDLEMSKQDLKEKQLKIEFFQKQKVNLERKSSNNPKITPQTNETYNEVKTLKHNLNALETKYRTISKQLANKQEYILKYITNRRASQDIQAVKGFVSQNERYSMRLSDQISQVDSQFQTSSQVHSVFLKSSKQL